MPASQMPIGHADGALLSELLLNFEAALLGIGVLHVPVHRGEIHQYARWQIAENIRKDGSARLSRGKARARLRQVREDGCVSARQESVCKCAQRDAIVIHPEAAADDGSLRSERRPGKPCTRRNI